MNFKILYFFYLLAKNIHKGGNMFTIIAFILTLFGCINWLSIGLLQYDFVAGIFGYQASVFSRIIYIIIGAGALFLTFKLIKGKGVIAVFSKNNKKDLKKNIDKIGNKNEENLDHAYSRVNANIEAGRDLDENRDSRKHNYNNYSRHDHIDHYDGYTDTSHNHHSSGKSLFDEEFNDYDR